METNGPRGVTYLVYLMSRSMAFLGRRIFTDHKRSLKLAVPLRIDAELHSADLFVSSAASSLKGSAVLGRRTYCSWEFGHPEQP